MIGSARMIRPIAAGIVSSSTSRTECASAERNSSVLPTAALRETRGSVTVATATPKIPSGNCIRRNAMFSQAIGPSPKPDGQRTEQVTKRTSPNDGAEIEKGRGHRRRAEHVARVQHSHHQRRERYQQDERKHDPGEHHGELRFFGRETGRKNVNEHRRK